MMECVQDYNHGLIKHLHKSIKLCQTEFVNKTVVATETNLTVAVMCKEWENIFLHGIKRRPNKGFFSIKSSNISEMPTSIINQINPFSNQSIPTFWLFLCEFLESEEIIRFTQSLCKVDSDMGRCRAWIRSAINEQTLESFLTKVLSNQGQIIAKIYYDSYALLLDPEENTVLPSLAAGLGSILFALEINVDHLNNFIDINRRFSLDSRSQNTSESSSSFYRPLLFSSSTSGSFEEVEIKETPYKVLENESTSNSKPKGRNRAINIVPIEDEDDSKSDSSDLYSPFSLLKTGLNLVSKFHFGADERLSDIKEQEHQNQSNDFLDGLDSAKKSHLIDCGLRECDETEFRDCCLSLQNDFYSPDNDHANFPKTDDSQIATVAYTSADLVVNSTRVSSPSLSILESCDNERFSVAYNDVQSNIISEPIAQQEEIRALNQLLEKTTKENTQLKTEINSMKEELRNREDEYKRDSLNILRENELLKKRLKEYIVKKDFSIDDEVKDGDSMDSSGKIEQLVQMHADLIELNDQLQRSLVDKDIKIGMLQSKVAKLMYNEAEVGIHIEYFGTIYIRIVDYFLRGCGSKKHHSYKISISCWPISSMLFKQNEEWVTYRRFKEFHKLYIELVNKYPVLKNIPFPSKWVYKANDEQLTERQKGLETFLRTVATFRLQQWIKKNQLNNNNHEISDCQSNISVISLASQGSGVQSHDTAEPLATSKKEAKEIITDIIPFLAPSLLEE